MKIPSLNTNHPHVGLLAIQIFLPHCHSLKEKRKIIKSVIEKVRSRFNVSIAEIEYHDKWQRCTLGVVIIANNSGRVEKSLDEVFKFIDDRLLGSGEIISKEITFL
ncbi:MAG: DUF503 domain-containing protein [Candidatus Marinimicrobia bacterium]|nr:DUF503 domain-containing protein [Candidatus Neomarinimicrobiota bacterium]MBL7046883.1 DUF503 domain-containing protein [Candidatus Neomarinimicrobiota bacterium]